LVGADLFFQAGWLCWESATALNVGQFVFPLSLLVPFFLPSADYAGVVVTDWMKTV
jgi:hypothetical protein